MDLHRLSGRGNQHDPAYRLAGGSVLLAPGDAPRLAGVPAQFAELRAGAEPVDADPDPGDAGGFGGGADPAVDATDPHRAAVQPDTPRHGAVQPFQQRGPGRRPVDRRLAGGCLFLALDLSPATVAGDRPAGRGGLVDPPPRRRPRTPAPGRLARHRRDGRRPRRAADRAGGRWPPRLVRVRLHPHLRRPRRARPAALRTAPTVGRAAVHQPAPAGQLQLRRVQPGDGGVRRGDLRPGVPGAQLPVPVAGFQRPADRRQPDPLRPRATAPGAAAAAPDALAEPQAAGGRRLRDHGPGLLDGRAPERRRGTQRDHPPSSCAASASR